MVGLDARRGVAVPGPRAFRSAHFYYHTYSSSRSEKGYRFAAERGIGAARTPRGMEGRSSGGLSIPRRARRGAGHDSNSYESESSPEVAVEVEADSNSYDCSSSRRTLMASSSRRFL